MQWLLSLSPLQRLLLRIWDALPFGPHISCASWLQLLEQENCREVLVRLRGGTKPPGNLAVRTMR